MIGSRRKIAVGLKYFWLNFLTKNGQIRALKWLSKADKLRITQHFNASIGSFRKVLLILPEKPYDLVLTQKSVIALKQHHPDMIVEVIAENANKDIIKSNPFIDGGLIYNRREFFYHHPAFRELIYSLKGRRYDACFLFNRDEHPLHFFLMANSGAPLRVAFTGSDAAPFVNLAVRPRKETEYEGDRYESLLRTLGVKVGSARLRWNIARSSEKDVEALLIQFGLRIDRPLIGIDVSPSVYDKGFPPELLKGLIDTLVAEDRAEIILFYSREQDREQMKSFSFLNRAIVPIPEDKISFATAFINKCSLIIALNNLVYQLGIMLGRPTVGLFENAESRQWICVAPGKFESVCAPRLKNLSLEEILSRVKSLMPLQA